MRSAWRWSRSASRPTACDSKSGTSDPCAAARHAPVASALVEADKRLRLRCWRRPRRDGPRPARAAFGGDVLREHRGEARVRLERDHTPGPADEMRAHEREVAPVGANVDDDHAGTEEAHWRAAFPAARIGPVKHTSREIVSWRSQTKLKPPRSARQAGEERRAREPGRARSRAGTGRTAIVRIADAETETQKGADHASLRATSTTLSDSAWGNICERICG